MGVYLERELCRSLISVLSLVCDACEGGYNARALSLFKVRGCGNFDLCVGVNSFVLTSGFKGNATIILGVSQMRLYNEAILNMHV